MNSGVKEYFKSKKFASRNSRRESESLVVQYSIGWSRTNILTRRHFVALGPRIPRGQRANYTPRDDDSRSLRFAITCLLFLLAMSHEVDISSWSDDFGSRHS